MKEKITDFGFLTLAFGKTYRKLAKNLLISYKKYGNTAPFCVVTDKADKYVKDFDIVLEKPPIAKGFYNKLYLEKYTPFKKTIFIDADCLIFKDLTNYFKAFEENNSPFSPFGKNFIISELNERVGYFDFEKTASFNLTQTYIFNGGLYYFNEKCNEIFETARKIADSNIDYGFPFPGDEPCLALAMSIHDCWCYQGDQLNWGLTWFPRSKNLFIDIPQGKINHQFGQTQNVDKTAILHFGTFNTYKPFYKSVVLTIKHRKNHLVQFLFRIKVIYLLFSIPYFFTTTFSKVATFVLRCVHFAFRILKNIFKGKK